MKKHKNSKIIASVSFTVLMVLAGVALWWRMARQPKSNGLQR